MSKAKKAKAMRDTAGKPRKVGLKVMPSVETRHPRAATDMGPPIDGDLCVRLPAPPATGKAYLISTDGVLGWEAA